MPYERPARGTYLAAPATINHGVPHYQGGLVGITQKQDEPATFDSLASRTQIASGKQFFLRTKGEAQVDATTLAGATLGQGVFIHTTTYALTLTDTANTVPFGRVTLLAGQRGTPTGFVRIDMDLKDGLANPL